MTTLTKPALGLAMSLIAFGATAAPQIERGKHVADRTKMMYQARNHKTLFNSERSATIDDLNRKLTAASQKGMAKASSLKPDFTLPGSAQFEYIDGPNGATYFCSSEFEINEVRESEYYVRKDITAYKFNIYDSNFKLLGEIKGKVEFDTTTNPLNPETRLASMGVTPIITRKYFNQDDKLEVLVYFNYNTPDYTVNSRSLAFSLGGEKDDEGNDKPICRITGNLCDVLDASPNEWTEDFYLTFANDYMFEMDPDDDSFGAYVNAIGARMETFKKADYGTTEPVKVFDYKLRLNNWPGDQESASPFISRCIDGKPYFITNGYTDGLWIFEENGDYGFPEQTWNPDTKFFVDIYQPKSLDEPNRLQHTEIDVMRSGGDNIFATFYYLGNLGYRDDINFEYCDEPGKANLVITTKDWVGAELGETSSYFLYGPDGELKDVLGVNVNGVLMMSDVAGQEPEVMFVMYENDQYRFDFLNPYNGNRHHSIDQMIWYDDYFESLYVNADRIADGDSYKYCFELGTPGRDDDGNDIMRIAWINTDGEITEIDRVNMGQEIRMAKVYIGQEVLSPYTFDTTDEREYMIIVKRGAIYSSTIQEEFIVATAASKANPTGRMLLSLTPDDTAGNLLQVSMLETDSAPMLWTLYYNNVSDTYSQEFYCLPLTKFAGGEGTAANPYQIATAGDLMCMRDNLSAHYVIVSDIDASTIGEFAPIGTASNPFNGSLKGNNHTISNLCIGGEGRYTGIFSYIDNAVISDLTFVNPTIASATTSYCALLAAQAQRSTISNVHVTGLTVELPYSGEFGSLVDRASLSTAITGCSVTNANINLPNASIVGGLVADTRTGTAISASAFGGAITAKSVIGGILGTSGPNSGAVTDCHVDADLKGENIVGGVIGDMDTRISVDRCYVEGTLEATTTYGTRIVSKGYAVGGIAGSVSTLYANNDSESGTERANDVITNCFVNLESITTPELPEGNQSSVHRIAGFTSINDLQPDWDNVTDYQNITEFLPTEAELGFKNNYVIASLAKIDGNIEADAASTEGKDIEAGGLNGEFFASLGFKYGDNAESPWQEVPENDPMLYHEFASKFVVSEIYAAVGDNFNAELLVISRKPMTEESFIDGFAGDIADESVAEMTGEITVNRNVAAIGFTALKEGVTEFTANVNGTLAKVKFNVLADLTGITDAVVNESPVISFDGATVFADNAAIEVYTIDGKRVAAGRNSVALGSLAGGVYVVAAKDAAGNRATKKFILQ